MKNLRYILFLLALCVPLGLISAGVSALDRLVSETLQYAHGYVFCSIGSWLAYGAFMGLDLWVSRRLRTRGMFLIKCAFALAAMLLCVLLFLAGMEWQQPGYLVFAGYQLASAPLFLKNALTTWGNRDTMEDRKQ